jgi:glutathione S-transferase
VQLALEQPGLPYRWVDLDSAAGQTRPPAFLAMNPNGGKVPMLECASEGGIALDGYPAIRAGLDRVRAQPGFVPMEA